MFAFEEEQKDPSQLNRDINLLGKYVDRLKKLKIFVFGLRSLGVEIIQNLMHFSPSLISIYDDNTITLQDVGSCVCYKETDVDNRLRQDVCRQYLKQINNKVKVEISALENPQSMNSAEFLHQFDLVIISDLFDFQLLVEINDICRQKKQKSVGFVYAGSIGLYSFLFSDYGNEFKVFDRDGEEAQHYFIENITKSDPGVVTINKDKAHNYQTGDFVRIIDVDGMKEVNGNEARPIRVIDQYSFQIEDTSEYSQYSKNGFVQTIKVPFRINYEKFSDYMKNPTFSEDIYYTEEKMERAKQLHLILLGVFKYYAEYKNIPDINSEDHSDILVKFCTQILKDYSQQEVNPLKLEKLDVDLCKNISFYIKTQFAPLSIYTGALIAKEVIVFVGKYSPLKTMIHFDLTEELPKNKDADDQEEEEDVQPEKTRYQDFITLFGNSLLQKLKNLSVTVVGSGGQGCELIKNLAILGVGSNKGKVYIIDDAKIKPHNVNIHFWLNAENLNQMKCQVVQEKMKQINPHINVESLVCRASLKNDQILDEKFWSQTNLIINTSDKKECKHYLHNKSIWFEKPLLDQNVHGLKGNTQIVIPFQTAAQHEIDGFFNYGSYAQDKESINEFPYLPIHNVIWAKEQFQFFFIETFKDLSSLIQNPNLYLSICRNSIKYNAKYRTRLLIMQNLLLQVEKINIELLINLSKELYELLFNVRIQHILAAHPPDDPDSNQKFWVGYKRMPFAAVFQLEDTSTYTALKFITVSTILLCQIFQVEFKMQEKSSYIKSILEQQYGNNARPKYFHLEEELSDQQVELMLQDLSNPRNYKQKDFKIQSFNLEFENMRNYYIEMLETSANLRAKCYGLSPIMKHQVDTIVNEVDRSCPFIQSIISSHMCFQLLSLIQQRGAQSYYQADFDMAVNKYKFIHPDKPEQQEDIDQNEVKTIPPNFTVWDKIRIYGPQTIDILINNFREKDQIILNNIVVENQLIWEFEMDNQDIILQKTPVEAFQEVTQTNISQAKSSIELTLSATTEDGRMCRFAKVKYFIRDGK